MKGPDSACLFQFKNHFTERPNQTRMISHRPPLVMMYDCSHSGFNDKLKYCASNLILSNSPFHSLQHLRSGIVNEVLERFPNLCLR